MTLDGERVRLRLVTEADHEAIVPIETDPDGLDLASDSPPFPSPDEVRAWLRRVGDRSDVYLFAVESRDDGGLLGTCSVTVETRSRVGEVGISMRRESWGTGAGTDAMRILVDTAFDHLNLRRVWLTVWAHNGRAIASYRKLGFVEEGRLRDEIWRAGRYEDAVVMAVLADEWRAPHD